jgi:hypothetical protein
LQNHARSFSVLVADQIAIFHPDDPVIGERELVDRCSLDFPENGLDYLRFDGTANHRFVHGIVWALRETNSFSIVLEMAQKEVVDARHSTISWDHYPSARRCSRKIFRA